jgi:hypothetical protein
MHGSPMVANVKDLNACPVKQIPYAHETAAKSNLSYNVFSMPATVVILLWGKQPAPAKRSAMPILSTIFSSDWLPSILVKESRQFVRSRLVTWVLCLELLGLVALTGLLLKFSAASGVAADPTLTSGPGRGQLTGVATVLLAALALAAFDGLLRTAREHDDHHGEMMFVTGLSAWRQVWGKLLSGWILGGLILAGGLPFLVLAYLMRGISLVVLGTTCLMLFEYSLLAVALALVLAKLSLPGFIRRIGGGGLLVLLAFFPYGALTHELIRSGSGNSRELAMLMVVMGVFGGMAVIMLLIMARFFFAPPQSRRTRVARTSLLILLVAFGFGLYLWWKNGPSGMEREIVAVITGGLVVFESGLALLVMALECRNFWWRRGNRLLLLDDGVGGGVLLCLFPMAEFLIALCLGKEKPDMDAVRIIWVFGAWLMISALAGWLIANVISRWFLRRLSPLMMAVVIGLLLFFGSGAFFALTKSYFGRDSTMISMSWIGIAVVLALLLIGSFLPPMPDPESLSPETPAPEPQAAGQEKPAVPMKSRRVADAWLIRPFAGWEKINPVFLKEFRQLWRSRAVSWMLWSLVGVILLALAWQVIHKTNNFWALRWSLALLPPTLAIIQLNRSLREIEGQEMLFITMLTPGEIRRGKTLSALLIGVVVGLPLQLSVLWMVGHFPGAKSSGDILSFLILPVACVALVTIAVAIAWSPLPSFHKRYLAPVVLVLLASPAVSIRLWTMLLEFFPYEYRRELLLDKASISPATWLVVWLVLWLAAAWAADRWLHRRAAWRNL